MTTASNSFAFVVYYGKGINYLFLFFSLKAFVDEGVRERYQGGGKQN